MGSGGQQPHRVVCSAQQLLSGFEEDAKGSQLLCLQGVKSTTAARGFSYSVEMVAAAWSNRPPAEQNTNTVASSPAPPSTREASSSCTRASALAKSCVSCAGRGAICTPALV